MQLDSTSNESLYALSHEQADRREASPIAAILDSAERRNAEKVRLHTIRTGYDRRVGQDAARCLATRDGLLTARYRVHRFDHDVAARMASEPSRF